jgi:hypothetical protein
VLESGSNSVGRVIAFQAIGRGFESRLPLQPLLKLRLASQCFIEGLVR